MKLLIVRGNSPGLVNGAGRLLFSVTNPVVNPKLAFSFLTLCCALAQAAARSAEWRDEGTALWKPLPVPAAGQTGFTRLAPAQTGVSFTNLLDDASSAANRVLENGGGVALGDFDQDGRPDIFLCSLRGENALYRNLGGWTFQNVTTAAGLPATTPPARGAVLADLNGDRRPDLLISTVDRGVLCFMNDAHGHFTNATATAGIQTSGGSTTLALADVDGNGTLDLYVTNYRPDDIRDRARVDVQRVNGRVTVAPWLRDRVVLTPQGLREFGQPDQLYLNDGHGHFTPVSWTSGAFLDEQGKPLTAGPPDWGLTATFRDLNGDGLPDLYVCNDYWTPDRIWINQGQGRFRALPLRAIRHTSENSMGVDVADVDRDGYPDLFVVDMLSRKPAVRKRQALAQTRQAFPPGALDHRPQFMRNTLFRNRGDGTFAEIADFAGLRASEWSWQPLFLDVDLDGYEDLLIPAGHRRDIQDMDATAHIQSLQHPWSKDMDPKLMQETFTRELMEHARFYPALAEPVLTFRNLGNLRFTETTEMWGTADLGVHQGIAAADLDGDGDLDVVVNNLNGVCGVYRNNAAAPRVAVQLHGASANTDGIGARISLKGGPVPVQTQEMVAGGRYLSGSAPTLVFAAGSKLEGLTLLVTWRSGLETTVGAVQPNRLYEIVEPATPAAASAKPLSPSSAPPLFQDVSERLGHLHTDIDFDDFARQPLLPRKLSQLGPGVSVADLNGDGHDDVVIGGGKGGRLAVYQGDGHGRFRTNTTAALVRTRDQTGLVVLPGPEQQPVILTGSANYDDGLAVGSWVHEFSATGSARPDSFPGQRSCAGPLAAADVDGDGDLDLFVGGRVIPGRYPEPASSALYLRTSSGWAADPINQPLLSEVGLVSGAVWSDLDSDGFPELILAHEWGPIRIFKNERGRLRETTATLGLAEFTGLWTGVTTADFDGDGRLDIAAANWGLNSPYRASREHPLELSFGDLAGQGAVDILEMEYDPKRQVSMLAPRSEFLLRACPFLTERFQSFRQFGELTIDQVLGNLRPRVKVLRATTLASTVFLNRGSRFEAVVLPDEAQFAPAFGLAVADFDGDGREDLFLSQNFFGLDWPNDRQDAGRGLLLLGHGDGHFDPVPGQQSGIALDGEQRGTAVADFDEDGRADLIVGQNNGPTAAYLNQRARSGLRVRLRGPAANPCGIGATVRVQFKDHLGPAREIHGGGGYGSQDSATPVLATPEPALGLVVRWPWGAITTNAVPPDARQVDVRAPK